MGTWNSRDRETVSGTDFGDRMGVVADSSWNPLSTRSMWRATGCDPASSFDAPFRAHPDVHLYPHGGSSGFQNKEKPQPGPGGTGARASIFGTATQQSTRATN